MKYILYARKSSEGDERQTLSIEAQLHELRQLAANEHLEIVASFEEARTAKDPGRTVFAEMLEVVERGDAGGILAWHPDRLARNSVDGGKIIHLLDTGTLHALKFPTFWFENTPQGKFMLSIAFGQSKYYVDNLSENVKRGIRQKLRRGEWPALAPVGYVNNLKSHTIDVDADKAPLVRKAFELYATGNYTLQNVSLAMKEVGLRSHKGNAIAVSSMQRMLRNSCYYGMISRLSELFQGSHEPIITKDLFDRVQAVMAKKAKKKRKRKHEFLFSGSMHCGTCKAAITAERHGDYVYYRCTKKMGPCEEKYLRDGDLLLQVKQIVEEVALPDDWAIPMLQHLDQEDREAHQDMYAALRSLKDEKTAIEQKLDKLLDLHLEGSLDKESYIKKKNTLLNRKVEIEEQIKTSERTGDDWLEKMRAFILEAQDAKKYLLPEYEAELPTFLKRAGSNVWLTGRSVRYEAARGWRAARQRAICTNWLDGRVRHPILRGCLRVVKRLDLRGVGQAGHLGEMRQMRQYNRGVSHALTK